MVIVVVGADASVIARAVAERCERRTIDLVDLHAAPSTIDEWRAVRSAVSALATDDPVVVAATAAQLADEPIRETLLDIAAVYGVGEAVPAAPGRWTPVRAEGRAAAAVAEEVAADARNRGVVRVDPRSEGRVGGGVAIGVIAIVTGIAALVGIVGVLALVAAPIGNQGDEFVAAPTPIGAPLGDEFVDLVAIDGDASGIVGRQFAGDVMIVPGTEELVARATVRAGEITFFRWQIIDAGLRTPCVGSSSAAAGWVHCGSDGSPLAALSGTVGGDGLATQWATVADAPDDARWVRVTTHQNHVVVAPVIGGLTHAEWATPDGRAVLVELLDEESEVVWSREFAPA